MDIESIDTLAKQLVPNSDVTNIWWWVSGIFLFVIGSIAFVFRHWLKEKILSALPLPRIFLLHNGNLKNEITIPCAPDFDSNAEFRKQFNEAIDKLKKEFPLNDLDVYNNMMLALPGHFQAAKEYNEDVQSYLDSMKKYYQNTIADQVTSAFLHPINLVLYAKGRKACTNLIVTIWNNNSTGAIFAPESARQCKAKVEVAPKRENYSEPNDSGWYCQNDQEEYTYRSWNPISASHTYKYKVSQLISGVIDADTIPSFYIDVRKPATYHLNWKVNGADIRENGITGEITINVK